MSLPSDPDASGGGWPQASDDFDQFSLPIAGDPGDTQYLALADAQGDAPQRRQALVVQRFELVYLECSLARLAGFLFQEEEDLAADHELGQLLLCLLSAMPSVAVTLPPRSTITRSAKAITSSSLWVIKMTDLPSSTIWRRVVAISSASWGVSTAVGSSRIRISAPRYSSLRISTRCCSPTESCQM